MKNKSNVIVTPETSLKALVESFDKALVNLDDATEHFKLTVLNKEDIAEGIKKQESKEEIRELMELLENYTMMAGFLIDHPLLAVIKQIREKSKLNETDPPVMAINAIIERGQFWKHYKGTTYEIVSVAKNANTPSILDIHYADEGGKTWALPIHEFVKQVTHEGKDVYRFSFEH